MTGFRIAWLVLLACLLAGCPAPTRAPTTENLLADYASAIRWNDFDKAVDFIDPALRESTPLTDLERERFKQVQVTGYEVKDRDIAPDGSLVQVVEIRLVNRNTQLERTFTDRQSWRFDPASRRVWLTSGLPDLNRR